MNTLLISALFFLLSLSSFSQTFSGKVINANSESALEFVNIGIIDFPAGTITDEKGNFKLDLNDISIEKKVRFSMIGFKSQIFTIKELINIENIIKLEEEPIQLLELIIKPSGKIRKIGTTNYARRAGVCGWGGTQFGKGHEIGTEIDLGTQAVKLKSLHLRLYKQSFDSTLFRLHIRSIQDNFPDKELLTDNIIITVSEESGWIDINLSQYNIVLSDKIILSLEWVKIYGVNKDRLIRMNKSKQYTANVLFSLSGKKASLFTRWGSEAKWRKNDNSSPAFYLTVQE